MDDIAKKIIDIIKEMLTDDFKGDTFVNQGINTDSIDFAEPLTKILSSIGIISLVVDLEKYYDIEITDEELVLFSCVNDLSAIIFPKIKNVDLVKM